MNILIIGYNRPNQTIGLIQKMLNQDFQRIFIAIDGPIKSDNTTIAKVQRYINSLKKNDQDRIFTWFRSENLGLATSVISGIDWFFSKIDKGIIIEDDVIIDKNFIRFIVDNQKYVDCGDIQMISGTNPLNMKLQKNVVISYPLIWGWYTNKQNWNLLKSCIFDKKYGFKLLQTPSVTSFWMAASIRSRFRIMDSWAAPLAAGFHAKKFKCLIPSQNLITNVGNDPSATHTHFFRENEILKISEYKNHSDNKMVLDIDYTFEKVLEKEFFQISNKNIFSCIFALINLVMSTKRERLSQLMNKVVVPS